MFSVRYFFNTAPALNGPHTAQPPGYIFYRPRLPAAGYLSAAVNPEYSTRPILAPLPAEEEWPPNNGSAPVWQPQASK